MTKDVARLADALFPYYERQRRSGHGNMLLVATAPCLSDNVHAYIVANYSDIKLRVERVRGDVYKPGQGTLKYCYELAREAGCADLLLGCQGVCLQLQVAALVFCVDAVTIQCLNGDLYDLVLPEDLGLTVISNRIKFEPLDIRKLLEEQHPSVFACKRYDYDVFAFRRTEVIRKSAEEINLNVFDAGNFDQVCALMNADYQLSVVWKS